MLIDRIEQAIWRSPGLTATQIANTLFGVDGYHQRVATACQRLWELGRTERRGKGGPGDPFTYFPVRRSGANTSQRQPPRDGHSEFDRA